MDSLLLSQVKKGLARIFNSRFNIDINNLKNEYLCKNLLGMDFGLAARDLLYIYFDVKHEFNIIIPEEDISQGKFSTFTGIIEIVMRQMELKEVSSI